MKVDFTEADFLYDKYNHDAALGRYLSHVDEDLSGWALYRMAEVYKHKAVVRSLGEPNEAKVREYFQRAVPLLLASSKDGDPRVHYALARVYTNGDGVDIDKQEGLKYYFSAAEKGLAPAQHAVGCFYLGGNGVDKNEKEGIRWIKLAVDQGFTLAFASWGLMYVDGLGVPKDYKEAVKWFKLSAEIDTVGMYNLGWAYETGSGIEANKEKR